MPRRPALRFLPAALTTVTVAALTGCGGSSPAPAADAAGPSAFAYDILHRSLAGPQFAKSDKKQLLSLGNAMCGALDKGHTIGQLDDSLVATKNIGATAEDDGKFVATVVVTLCPKYASQFTAAAASVAAKPTRR